MSFYPFLVECSPTRIDYRKKGTLVLTSLVEDLVCMRVRGCQVTGQSRGRAKCKVAFRCSCVSMCEGLQRLREKLQSL